MSQNELLANGWPGDQLCLSLHLAARVLAAGLNADDRFLSTLQAPRQLQDQVVAAGLLLGGRLDLPVMQGWRVAHLPVELQKHPRALAV